MRDAGETGTVGWSVRLLNEHSQLIGTRTTAGDGHYAFVDLPPGDYRVEQVMTPTGWRQSSPGGPVIGGLDVTSGGASSPKRPGAGGAREALRTSMPGTTFESSPLLNSTFLDKIRLLIVTPGKGFVEADVLEFIEDGGGVLFFLDRGEVNSLKPFIQQHFGGFVSDVGGDFRAWERSY